MASFAPEILRAASILRTFGAKEVYVFGSAANGSLDGAHDVDMAERGLPDEVFYKAMGMASAACPLPLDLIDLSDDSPFTRFLTLETGGLVLVPDNRLPKLAAKLDVELSQLRQLLSKAASIVELHEQDSASLTETFAAGALLHAFYNGVENLFKCIAKDYDEKMPASAAWHRDLLRQMSQTEAGSRKRNSVISSSLEQDLAPYLDFRHAFRNIYSHELKWLKLRPLLKDLHPVHAALESKIQAFMGDYLQD